MTTAENSILPQDKQYSLTKEQTKAVWLLSGGTFLEYFDLMLFVHMAVLLNDLFFPKTDPHIEKLLIAFTFCSTYVFRIFGALVFGYIGDKMGRKHTVVLTTMMMATSCLIMANLPTYEKIGITATWVMLACRTIQGMSSMGEIIGGQLYLTESIKRPMQYFVVPLLFCFASLGGFGALGVGVLATSQISGFNWRLVFWFGLAIGIVGTLIRTVLRETPEFADARKRLDRIRKLSKVNKEIDPDYNLLHEKVKFSTSFWYFIANCINSFGFYFIYFYCGDLLKNKFNCTAGQIISNNFQVSIVAFCVGLTITILGYFFYPLKVLKIHQVLFAIASIFYPVLLYNIRTPEEVFWLQVIASILWVTTMPADSIFFSYFPVFRRFTYSTMLYALAVCSMQVLNSVGAIYLTKHLGHYGLLVLAVPLNALCFLAIRHFEMLEKNSGRYTGGWRNRLY